MICPNCKSEFIEGITTCPDCQVRLVDHVSENIPEHYEETDNYTYVQIYTPISSQELALIKMIMEREGIPYIIKNEPLHRAVIFSIRGPGEIQLYVPEQYAEATRHLLAEELGHT